jgi:hypothetical protein
MRVGKRERFIQHLMRVQGWIHFFILSSRREQKSRRLKMHSWASSLLQKNSKRDAKGGEEKSAINILIGSWLRVQY